MKLKKFSFTSDDTHAIIACCVLLVLCIVLFIVHAIQVPRDYLQTEAICVSYVDAIDGDHSGGKLGQTYVGEYDYYVDDNQYSINIVSSERPMLNETKCEVYYNPNKPTEATIKTKNSLYLGIGLSIMLLFLSILFVLPFAYEYIQSTKQKCEEKNLEGM